MKQLWQRLEIRERLKRFQPEDRAAIRDWFEGKIDDPPKALKASWSIGIGAISKPSEAELLMQRMDSWPKPDPFNPDYESLRRRYPDALPGEVEYG